MVKIKSEGEYLLKSGAGSIFRKYTQNSRVPPTAAVVGDTPPPPPFGYKFPNTIPIGNTTGGAPTLFLTGELVTAVDMWAKLSTRDDAVKKYGDIKYWDVSQVTNMRMLFSTTRNSSLVFNGDISKWDVSNVTDMRQMFLANFYFNQPIGHWDTSRVTLMTSMFSHARLFNQPIGEWNTSGVTDMGGMFGGAVVFDQRLGSWDVAGVTDMSSMFFDATAFMNNGDNYTHTANGISKWKPAAITTSNLTTQMFKGIANTGSNPVWSNLLTNGLVNANGNVTTAGVAAPPPGSTPSTGIFYK